MPKIDISVGSLVDKVKNQELRLPVMQRGYVWPATRVRDLLDSLYRGYPSGSILVWETTKELPTREMAVEQKASPFSTYQLLLDGQQRLTSLTAILKGEPIKVKNRKRPIEILFNLEHPEGPPAEVLEVEGDEATDSLIPEEEDDADEDAGIQERLAKRTFVVSSRALLAIPTWVKVSHIFVDEKSDWDILKPIGLQPDDPRYSLYCKRLQRVRNIRNYEYVMHVLERGRDYEEVTEIFVRVNSLGVKLRGTDLALAQVTARWPNSLEEFETYIEEYDERTGFTLDLGLVVRAIVIFATRQCRFRTVGSITIDRLQAAWVTARESIDFAINFLRTNAGIEDEALLSSPLILLCVAAYGQVKGFRLSGQEQGSLTQWTHIANAKGHYSRGSSETLLDADLSIIFRGGAVEELIDVLRRQFGRLYVDPGDFAGRGTRNPLFSMSFLALKKAGAKDWWNGLNLSLAHKGKAFSIETHHIFPKAVLRDAGVDDGQIHEIANFAFLSSRANKAISSRPPVAYLPDIVNKQGEEGLRMQLVPTDRALWEVAAYDRFLEYRRERLADAVNDLLGQTRPKADRPSVDIRALIANGESEKLEFKSSARWDLREKRVNSKLELAIVKTVAGLLNSDGGVLLLGIDDEGRVVGLEPDIESLSGRPTQDGYEQHLMNLFCRHFGSHSSAYIHLQFHQIDGKHVCLIQADPANRPIYFEEDGAEKMYIRAGNTTKPLNPKEAVEYARERWKTVVWPG